MPKANKEQTYRLGIKALIENGQGQLLVLRVTPDTHKGFAYWDIPGGRVLAGQTVKSTLLREVKEETGISKLKKLKFVGMTLSPLVIPAEKGKHIGLILSVYSAEVAGVPKIKLSAEHVDYKWISKKLLKRYLKHKYPPEFLKLL
jgi:8-oxo-dGTP pyrophosphatase MutT (NUDIX family)